MPPTVGVHPQKSAHITHHWVSFICEGWEDACTRPGGIPYHPLPLALGVAGYPPYPCHRVLALRLAWCVCPGVARGKSCIRSPCCRGPRRRPALAHHAGFGQPGLRGQHEVGARTWVHHPGVQRRPTTARRPALPRGRAGEEQTAPEPPDDPGEHPGPKKGGPERFRRPLNSDTN